MSRKQAEAELRNMVGGWVFLAMGDTCQVTVAELSQAAGISEDAAEAFLEANAGEACVFTLPSGLQLRIDEAAGDNARTPGRGEMVQVHYEGRLLDGTVFDSSYERGAPAVFPSDRLIAGWVEALGQIREGETWTLFLHPDLAYGEQGTPGGPIGPNSALIFRMELLGLPQRDANGE
jgi:FKBP-type peptidyl-prolyl cis-trans isomerase FklB